jgi:peptide/nickel transport system permease protein
VLSLTLRALLRRLVSVAATVFGIVLVGFVLVPLAPGDPVVALAGEYGDASYYADMRARFQLDAPLPAQMLTYFAHVLRGDFSFSYVHGRPTLAVIAERIPATLLLTGTALLLAIVIAVPLATVAARRQRAAPNVALLTLYSAPVFWLGQLALILFAVRMRLFPVQGMASAIEDERGTTLFRAADIAWHLALPALALAVHEAVVLFRLLRAGLLDELSRDHVRTARAKGLSETRVILRHALPRAAIPALALIGTRVGQLVAGAVVVEIIFGWPGVGRLLYTALQARDAPILLGLFFVVSFAVVFANLLTDIAQGAIDPRVTVV